MELSQDAIQPETAWGTLASYDGATVTIVALTAAGIEAATESMEFLSELTSVPGREVSTDDAPSYVRPTAVAAWTISGPVGERLGTLGYAEGEDPRADLTGAPSVAGWAFVSAGGSDAARKIISVNRFPETGGGPDFAANAPNGFATAAAESRTLLARVTSVEARTVAGVEFVDGNIDAEALAGAVDPYITGGGGGTSAAIVPVAAILAADAVDGPGVQFTSLGYSSGAAGSGIVPADFVGQSPYVDMDVATITSVVNALGGSVDLLVYSGGSWSVRHVTTATAGDAWPEVPATIAVSSGITVDLASGVAVLRAAAGVAMTGTGLTATSLNLQQGMLALEGAMDRHRWVSAVAESNVNVAAFGAATWTYGGLRFVDGNDDPVDFCEVWLKNQTDPMENGIWKVDVTTYAGTQYADPAVFDPPGNGSMRQVSCPGDPHDGLEWEWLDDDPTVTRRVSTSTPASASGRWVVSLDPTITSGTGDVVGPASATDNALAQYDGTTGKLLSDGPALDTDGELAADSDTVLATQKAVKSYVDARFPIHRSAAAVGRRLSTFGPFSTATVSGMTTAGSRVFVPVFLPAGTYNTMSIRTTSAGTSTWRLGLYNGASGDPTRPGTVLKDAGVVDMSVTPAMLTLSSLAITVAADGWYWFCAQVETYTSAPTLVVAYPALNTALPVFPGWPGDESSYTRGKYGYGTTAPSAGALTTAGSVTGNAATGLDYAGTVPRFWIGA